MVANMMACIFNFLLGLPVKPLIYVKRVFIPLEEQFKYLSDESSDDSDEEWTLGPQKKKGKKDPTANAGMILLRFAWFNSSHSIRLSV